MTGENTDILSDKELEFMGGVLSDFCAREGLTLDEGMERIIPTETPIWGVGAAKHDASMDWVTD